MDCVYANKKMTVTFSVPEFRAMLQLVQGTADGKMATAIMQSDILDGLRQVYEPLEVLPGSLRG